MKKLISILFIIGLCVGTYAQLPTKASKIKAVSVADDGRIKPINYNATSTPTYSDTLKSGDTLFYKVLVSHSVIGYPYISWNTKLVAADTTSKIDFWQSVDGVHNWQRLTKDSTGIAVPTTWYPILIAKSTTAGVNFSFWQVAARFESQYLGIRVIANVKTGFKTIYYGSIRFNKN